VQQSAVWAGCLGLLVFPQLTVLLSTLQLAWRPGRPTKDGLCCAVVTAGGSMLIGYIGMRLQPFDAAPPGVRAVAWSPDGQQMAFAAGDEVTVLDWASRTSFSTIIPVKFQPCSAGARLVCWCQAVVMQQCQCCMLPWSQAC
jgi:hypothetical protein